MANGKIIYTPLTFKSLSFDEAHFFAIDDGDFNFGTGDFALDALLYVDAAVNDSESWIAAKGASNLASAAGWHWYYTKADRKLNLRINDGDASPTVVSSDAAAFAFADWFWARVTVDRDGNASFYVDGSAVGSGSVAAAANSVNNTDHLKLGAYDASTNRHKGSLGFFRVDIGRLLAGTWLTEENNRIKYGFPRLRQDFSAYWTFGDTLIDITANAYTLLINTGSATYAAGWPSGTVSYTFNRNFNYGHKPQFLEADDLQRSLDGSLFAYTGPRKQSYELDFLCYQEQVTALQAIYAGGHEFDFYEDGTGPKTLTARMIEPPDIRSKTVNLFDVGVKLVEI